MGVKRPLGGFPLTRAVACFVGLLLLVARVADAHVHLRRTDPAPGARLDSVPREIRFWFSEPVQLPFTVVTVTAKNGGAVTTSAPVSGAAPAELDVALVGKLAAGAYTVAWRTVSADGHPAHGTFTFAIVPNARGLATADSVDATAQLPIVTPPVVTPQLPTSTFEVTSPLYVLVRWLSFVALLIAIGSVIFLAVVLPTVGEPAGQALARDARNLGAAAAWFLVALTLMRFFAQSSALRGAPGMPPPALAAMLLRTAWGIGWIGEVALAAALALAIRGTGTVAAVVMAALLAFMPAMSGHPVAMESLTPLMVFADGVHVTAAAAWLGTLFVIATVGLSAALRLEGGARMRTVATMINRFSPVALASAGAIVITGTLAAYVHLGSLEALAGSMYGRVLLVKLACFGAILGLGAFHERVSRRRLASDTGATGIFRRSAFVELGLAAVLLVVTAILVVTSPPLPR